MSKFSFPRHWFAKQYLRTWLYVVGGIILVAAGSLWWFGVQTQPQRVFAGMLEQSLRTTGVTLQSSQEAADSNITYTLQYSLGAENRAHAITKIEQPGATVTTEVVGTPTASYTRYMGIETDQTNSAGEPLDLSHIEGVWSVADATEGSGLLGQAVLGLGLPLGSLPVPIANLAPEQRKILLDQIRRDNVYEVDYSNVSKERVDGRLQYTYNVRVQVILYASLMKRFGQLTGIHDLDNLDPNAYGSTPPLELQLTVDARSRHLVAVQTADEPGAHRQLYTAYDVPVRVTPPDDEGAISSTELQRRLQELY